MIDVVEERIHQIESILNEHFPSLKSGGLSEGILGLSLFYFYFYQLTKEESVLQKILDCIEQSIGLMHKDSDLELIELGRYLCFLQAHGYLEEHEILPYLRQIDALLDKFFYEKMKRCDLDAYSGIIPLGHYYLSASDFIDRKDRLSEILQLLDQHSLDSKHGVFWMFKHSFTGEDNIELGQSHGISGVINLLLAYYQKGIQTERCLRLINGGLSYILNESDSGFENWFPLDTISRKRIKYFNLAYGDIGIGWILMKAGTLISSQHFFCKGMEVLENAARFRDDNNIYIKDAEIIYGSAGLQLIFDQLYRLHGNQVFLDSSKYWLDKTLAHNNHNTVWAGYETYINGFRNQIQLSLTHGVCGIGIVLISYKLGDASCLQFLRF